MSGSTDQPHVTRRTALGVLTSAGLALAADRAFPWSTRDAGDDDFLKLLPKFTEKSRALLRRLLDDPNYSGQISAAGAATLVKLENTNVDQLMLNLLPLAQSYSHAPISNFYVGAVARGASGSLYTGANIEIPGRGELEAVGNIIGKDFEIRDGHQVIAQVSRSWFRVRDTYGVDVAPGENDALIVCIAICLDRIHDDTERDH